MKHGASSNKQIILWVISLLVVVSMLCGLVGTLVGGSQNSSSRAPSATPVLVAYSLGTPTPMRIAQNSFRPLVMRVSWQVSHVV